MDFCRKTILLLILTLFMSVGWGQDCDEGVEVDLWGECYNIETTTFLNLSGSGLTGEIPPEIGNLTYLIGLVLSSNQLIGEIPSEIGALTNLTGLFLNNNQLTGRIPSEIGNLTNLTNLNLSDNELTEEIPPEIGNVSNLFQLLLNNNQLMGEIPESICNIDIFWISFPYFDIDNNLLCPPYPECLSEEDIGYQDTSECLYIGDECFTDDEVFGYYDCDLCCQTSELIDNWLGDGVCDMYLFSGCSDIFPNFHCFELGYDCGDCESYGGTPWDGSDPLGFCYDCIIGDVNNDSLLDVLDIVSMITLILDGEYNECGDVNFDGELNVTDIVTFVNIILSIP